MIKIKIYSDARLKVLVRLINAEDRRAVEKALNVLKVGLWFERLRSQLGRPSAYRLGQILQPSTYIKGEHHHNLWAKYAAGMHFPGPETIRSADAVVPGSGDILTAAAWDPLDVARPLGASADVLLRRLRPRIQVAVFDAKALERGRYLRRKALRQLLKRLEGQAGLDSVAALVVLLREAYEAGQREHALEIGRSLHSTLLLSMVDSPLRWMSEELFVFFIRFIFPMASDSTVAFDLDSKIMERQLSILERTVLQLEDAGWDGYLPGGHTRQLRRLLTIDFGFDLYFGLSPRLKLVVPRDQSNIKSQRHVDEHNVAWEWGLLTLHAGKRERLMPTDVVNKMMAPRPTVE